MTIETEAFSLTRAEYVDFYAAMYERRCERASMSYLTVLAPCAAIAWFALNSENGLGLAIGGAALAVFVLYLYAAVRSRNTKRYAEQSVRRFELDLMEQTTFRITEEELVSTMSNGSVTKTATRTIRRLDCDSALVLVLDGGTKLVYLPRRVFRSEDDYEAYRSWTAQLVKKRIF